jgi:hypothetical protein
MRFKTWNKYLILQWTCVKPYSGCVTKIDISKCQVNIDMTKLQFHQIVSKSRFEHFLPTLPISGCASLIHSEFKHSWEEHTGLINPLEWGGWCEWFVSKWRAWKEFHEKLEDGLNGCGDPWDTHWWSGVKTSTPVDTSGEGMILRRREEMEPSNNFVFVVEEMTEDNYKNPGYIGKVTKKQ